MSDTEGRQAGVSTTRQSMKLIIVHLYVFRSPDVLLLIGSLSQKSLHAN